MNATCPPIPTDSARKAAAAYLALGQIPIPVPTRAKAPILDKWPALRLQEADLPKYFPDDRSANVGLILDAGIVDLDLDASEAVAAGRRWLPRTGWISGRVGKPNSHYWYRANGPVKYQAFDGPDGTRLLELRAGTGHQTIVSPSIHPDGDDLLWHAFSDGPAELAASDLVRFAGEVAALALLARYWPRVPGRRQDAFLALAGGLARAQWKPGRAEEFLAALADLVDDEEVRKRVNTFTRTATKVAVGAAATGWKRLSGLLGSHGQEVIRLIRSWLGCDAADSPDVTGPEPWPELIPLLSPLPELPPFPDDILPSWLGEWAAATAVALQVPLDLPATLGLAVCSAGIAQKFEANPRPGWFEPVNTYWLTALPPSDRKTQTFTRAIAPVFDLQDRARQEAAPARREAEGVQKALIKRANRLEDQYAKAKDDAERQQFLDDLHRVREELAEQVVPPVPLLIVDDETPDNLTKVLCEQGGRMLQASAEGTLFENIERWSDKPSFDVYLKAYSGDPLGVGRVTRDRTECRHPALTCAIAPQPAVIEALGEHPSLAGRGFLARWFYSLPTSKIGRRIIGAPPVPDRLRDAYRDGIISLWNLPATVDDEGKPKAWLIKFTREADEVIRQFEREIEPQLGEGQELWFLHGWAGKAAGGAVRIAAILHVTESVARGLHRLEDVTVAVAERAVRLVRDYLIPHAKAAFGLIGTDPKVNRAKRLVRWFTTRRLTEFTVRDVHQDLKGSIRTVDDLMPVLDLIERHHYIRQVVTGPRTGPGRPRSPKYQVNPEALAGDPGRRGPDDDIEDNGDIETGVPTGGPRGGPMDGSSSPTRPPSDSAPANGNSEDSEDIETENCRPNVGGSATGMAGEQQSALESSDWNIEDSEDIETPHASPHSSDPAGEQIESERSIAAQYPQYPQNSRTGLLQREESGDDFSSQYPQYPQNSKPGGASDTGGSGDLTADAGVPSAAQYPQNPQYSEASTDGPSDSQSGTAGPTAGYDGDVSTATPFLLVDAANDLALVASAIAESSWVGLDTETTGLDPRTDRLRLLSLDCDTVDGGRMTYLVDAFAVELRPLWEALADVQIVIHNAAFDLAFLGNLGFVPGRVHDTLLMSQVLYTGARTRGVAPLKHGLKDCCQRELGLELAKDLQESNWAGKLSHEQLTYAANDAAVLVPLYRHLMGKLDEAKLTITATIESAAIPCLAWMSAAGVPFDRERWRSLATTARSEAEQAKSALDAVAPQRPGTLFNESWNWDSPEQVKEALALAGCTVESTADGILASLDHPLAALLRDHRDGSKRASTYGDAWLKHVARDGRVYPRWIQLGANSGRMACSAPNMQNLPRGDYRKCVAAQAGRVLVKADYSQVELRIAAKVSGDQALLAAYQRGEDLHTLTARQVLGIAEVTKEHRQLAKALNFGLLYGMGAKGFRNYARANYRLELTEDQATGYREAFFKTYPGLRRWHRSVGDKPRDTRTLAGRRAVRVEQFNEKLNLPVQGTGADGLKKALALLWERRAECPTAVPVLAVHDEIVVECPEADAGPAAAWLKQAMLDGIAPLIAPVPVEVEVKVGRTWGGD
jgi:DNA polymerase I-like protein with 3'-5' exonuclease and polymerase domains